MEVIAFGLLQGCISSIVMVRNRANTLKINQYEVIRLVDRCDRFIKYLEVIEKKPGLKEIASKLETLLKDIEMFLAEHYKCQLIQRIIYADQFHRSLRDFTERLTLLADAVECKLFLDSQKIRAEDDIDRKNDSSEIMHYIKELEFREETLLDKLQLREEQYMEALYIMDKKMKSMKNGVERQFLSTASTCIQRVSGGQRPKLPSWLVSQWEVTLKHKIASGGYGNVFIGEWNSSLVAIKVIKKKDKMDDFIREVETWFNELSRHPHVLPLYKACNTADEPFMVCEYMSNGHLIQYLKKYPDQSIRTLKEAACGMCHLHNNNVIHGDLKAINILVSGEGRAKVADFGFSFTKESNSNVNIGGTLRWMSAELLRKEQPDFPVDVYAFGMTIYEIFNDYRPPYCDCTDDQVKDIVLRGIIPPALRVDPKVWSLIVSCLSYNPEDRPTFEKIVELLTDLPNSNAVPRSSSDNSSVTMNSSNRQSLRSHNTTKATAEPGSNSMDMVYKRAMDGDLHALEFLQEQANLYNIRAMMKLGDMYMDNRARLVPVDYKIAHGYFRQAADTGDDVAQFRLAHFYLEQCHPPQREPGLIELEKASAHGNISAMNYLGKQIQKQSPRDAFNLFQNASQRGYMKSYLNLGECYLRGPSFGTEVNIPKAIESLTIAAEQGQNPGAYHLLGILYSNLEGISQWDYYFDLQKAIYCLQAAVDLGFRPALIELSQIYFHGFGIKMPVEARLTKSKQLLEDATKANVVPAYFYLGKSYEDGLHQEKNVNASLYYYQMGSERGCIKCRSSLERLRRTSIGSQQKSNSLLGRMSMVFK